MRGWVGKAARWAAAGALALGWALLPALVAPRVAPSRLAEPTLVESTRLERMGLAWAVRAPDGTNWVVQRADGRYLLVDGRACEVSRDGEEALVETWVGDAPGVLGLPARGEGKKIVLPAAGHGLAT